MLALLFLFACQVSGKRRFVSTEVCVNSNEALTKSLPYEQGIFINDRDLEIYRAHERDIFLEAFQNLPRQYTVCLACVSKSARSFHADFPCAVASQVRKYMKEEMLVDVTILPLHLKWVKQLDECHILVRKTYKCADKLLKRQASGHLNVVVERSHFRDYYKSAHVFSLQWNGLNGYALQSTKTLDPARFANVFAKEVAVKPWNRNGTDACLLGQTPGDVATFSLKRRFGSLGAFYEHVTKSIKAADPSLNVLFRPHPEMASRQQHLNPRLAKVVVGGTLTDFLRQCRVVVSGTSTSAVTAVIEGYPSIALDPGSMAWDVSSHTLSDIPDPPNFSRKLWLQKLAMYNWFEGEIASGEAFKQIFNVSMFV